MNQFADIPFGYHYPGYRENGIVHHQIGLLMFITEEDYKVVIGDNALKVISQVSEENRANAEMEAQEEISGYLRPKYDCTAIFEALPEHRLKTFLS